MSVAVRRRSRTQKPLSCAECRRLKIKCELVFPCNHCVKRGLGSICPDGELVNGSRGTKILATTETLHERIRQLEQALGQINDAHPLLAESLYGGPDSDPQPPSDLGTDKRNNGYLIVCEIPEVSQYYGSAGSLYLSKRAVPSPPPSPVAAASTNFRDPFSVFHGSVQTMSLAEIISVYLPDEATGRAMSDRWFGVVGLTTRIIQPWNWDEKFFLHVYRNKPYNIFPQRLAVVFLMFAGICRLDSALSNQSALDFSLAARTCLAIDSTHSVTFVQCCYLYGWFLMNGAKEVARGDHFWPMLRSAMGIAEAVGLHRDPSQWGLDDETTMERRFVFWSIHHYDVVQSVALGRGQGIADNQIDCEIPQGPGDYVYYTRTYQLIRIVSMVNELQARVRPVRYSEVCHIDAALTQFEKDLPGYLSSAVPNTPADLINPASKTAAIHRNQLLLYLNEARLALHRPWYVRALREFPTEPTNSPYKQSLLGCLEACRAIISLVTNMVAIHGSVINRRWHFFFHLFSACTCLAACGIQAPSSTLTPSAISELERGVGLFKMAQADILETVMQLRNAAVNSFRQQPTGNEEGSQVLDLLGVTSRLRRQYNLPDPFATVFDVGPSEIPPLDTYALPQNFFEPVEPPDLNMDFDIQAFMDELGFGMTTQ